MKPIINLFKFVDNNILQDFSEREVLEKKVYAMFENKELNRIFSEIKVYFTVVVNPKEELLETSIKCSNQVYLMKDPLLESNQDFYHDIYMLELALTNLDFPISSAPYLIMITTKSIEAYLPNSNKEHSEQGESVNYVAIEPKWTFDEIVLSEDVRKRLFRAASIIKNKDIILRDFEYNRVDKSLKSIVCLYGPPGTGKTITAQGFASYLGKKIIMSSYAQIESKYVGDGAKNLRKIFKIAEEKDAVLFMDEADSFLSKRIENTSSSSDKHYNRMSNELFQLLEEHNGCVIFATNLLADLDNAFKSRIVDSIYFPLPNHDVRKKIVQKMVPSEILDKVFDTSHSIDDFIEEIDGFSGRDIRKALLLSYADAAILKQASPIFQWSYDLFHVGFHDVLKSFSEDTEDIPIDEVQKFEDELRLKRAQLDIAKYAVLADGSKIDEREFSLINNLSLSLINKEADKNEMCPNKTLDQICNNIHTKADKLTILDTAIRVITVDGDFSLNELTFLRKLYSLLFFDDSQFDLIEKYTQAMADAYSLWIKATDVQKTED